MSILTYVAAAVERIDPSLIGINDPVKSSDTAMLNVLNTVYLWAGIVSVIIIIIAGFIYVTSNGNAANIKKGKDAIMGAVIGLVIIILAFTITQFVLGRFQ